MRLIFVTFLLLTANLVFAAEPGGLDLPVRVEARFFYPPQLIRQSVSGRVVLAYSVGTNGKPQKIVVLVSDDPRLEGPAREYLQSYDVDVPKTWEADGGPWRRFHLQVTFAFDGDPPLPRLSDDGDVITITYSQGKPHRATAEELKAILGRK